MRLQAGCARGGFVSPGVDEFRKVNFDDFQAHVVAALECHYRVLAKSRGQVGAQQSGFSAAEQEKRRSLAGCRFPAHNFCQDS